MLHMYGAESELPAPDNLKVGVHKQGSGRAVQRRVHSPRPRVSLASQVYSL